MSTKEWLAAIGALSMSLNPAQAQQSAADGKAGVAAAVNTTTSGAIAGATRTLFVGNDVFRDERISTDAGGRAQLLFLDQSAITIGPGAEVVIDRFIYDERSKLGNLSVQASRGLLRFVGGDLSKQQDVVVRTPTMTIGIRGGITLINVAQNGATQAVFMFGSQLTATSSQGGQTQVITRPGFGISVSPGEPPGPPARISADVISGFLSQLEAPPGGGVPGSGGGPNRPMTPVPPPLQAAPDRLVVTTTNPNPQTVTQTLRNLSSIQDTNQLRNRATDSVTQIRARS